jgi:hypothetical protein
MSAFVKIPLQALILITGVLMFVYFLFRPAPLLFNEAPVARIQAAGLGETYAALQGEYATAYAHRRDAAEVLAAHDDAAARNTFVTSEAGVQAVRRRAVELVKQATGDSSWTDVNYVFPTFVVRHMPVGLVGLIIAAIFAAAMSSIAAELNSLATATVIDIYKRLINTTASDAHYLRISRLAVAFWGVVACIVAHVAVQLGSLIEVVNRMNGVANYGRSVGIKQEQVRALGVGHTVLRFGQPQGQVGAEDGADLWVRLGDLGHPGGPVEAVVVGEREGVQSEPGGFFEQVLGLTGAVEEAEGRVRVQFGVRHDGPAVGVER